MPPRLPFLRRLATWALLLALLGAWVAARAQPAPVSVARESAVKAAFLYKFGSFVEWPPTAFAAAADPLVIGVAGDDDVAEELEQLTQGRQVEGRPVRVVRVRDVDSLPRLHVLFVGAGRAGRMREMLENARGPVLTVTDGPGAARAGAVLHFVQAEGRVRFGASLTAAQARKLKLSARLLAVAQSVEGRSS